MSDSQKSHAQLTIENQQLRSELEFLRTENKALKHSGDKQLFEQVEGNIQGYADVISNMHIGLLIYHLEDINDDRTLRLVHANPAASEFTGTNLEKLTGKRIDECFPGLRDLGLPQRFAEVVRTGEGFSDEDVPYSDQRVVEGVYNTRAFALPNQHLGVAFEDVTEHKQTEEALRESEERFRMAFEHAPIGMVCTDGRGRFLQVNPAYCRMLGYSEKELLKLGVADITHPDDKETSLDCIQKLNDGQLDTLLLEKRYICKDGHIIWAAVNSSAVNDAQGNHLYQLAQIQDISERKQADKAFHTMMETTVGTTGQAFFDTTVQSLCNLLDVECAIIGEIENGDHIRALAMQLDGKTVEGHEYDLPGTPCSNVVTKGYCAYPEGFCELFPDDKDLAEMKAEAYVGVPLRDQHGEAVGVLCVISRHKLSLPPKIQEIFEIIAVKAAAEIERKQAEEGLLLYETTVSTFTDMLAVMNKEFVYMAANPAYLAAFNKTYDEMIGHTVSEVFGEEFFNEVIRPQAERCLGGEEVNYQAWFDFPAFESRYMDIHYYPYTSKTGELVGFIVNARNITERKQAEKDIRESEEKYRSLMQNAQDAIFIADGESGILIDANRRAEELIGLPRENIIGMHHSQLHPEAEAERYKELFRDRVESGDSMVSESVYVQHRDGSKIPVEISAGVIEVGGKKLVQGLFHDITKRKQAAESLRKSENKYSTLIESANDGVVIVQDMQFKFCNRAMADITGYSLDELQGMNFLTPIDAEFRELVSERYRQRLAGENPPDQYALRFVCKDGVLKEIEASSIRRSRYEDRPAITVVYRDITEQKRAQDEASRLLGENRRLSRQLMQSHEDERRYIARELHDELGQSLTAIDTASRLISLRSKEEGVVDKANEIGQITGKLFKDVRSLLVTIRPPMLDSVGLSAALENMIAHWKVSTDIACTLNISGSTDDFPDIVNIVVYRVLQECLTNISRHSEADQVNVSLCRVTRENGPGQFEEVLQLDVRDNGQGMNLEAPDAMGLGMVGIRERVHALEGSCVFNSLPDQGMHTSIMIPITMDSSEE